MAIWSNKQLDFNIQSLQNIILIQYQINKMEHLPSQISLNSHLALSSQLKGKTVNSTNQTSKVQGHDSTLGIQSQNSLSITDFDRVKEVNRRISMIEQCQSELHNKFEKVIQSLQREISKKDEANGHLEGEIIELRAELEESKKDLNIIVAYLNKKKSKNNQHQSRRINLNSTKASGNIEKSISNTKATMEMTNKQTREDKKNRSPRLLLKKSYKV